MKRKIGRPKMLKADKKCFLGVTIAPALNEKVKERMKATGQKKAVVIAEMIGAFNA